MAESQHDFERFFDRDGFNRSLGHFQAVTSLLGDFDEEFNLADVLNVLLSDKEIEQKQLGPILSALLVDKFGYITGSYNMDSTLEDFEHFRNEAATWDGVDVVLAYHHPELGFTVINPKNPDHWESTQSIRKNELVTIYAGSFAEETDTGVAEKAIATVIRFLSGKTSKSPAALLKGEFTFNPYEAEEDDEADGGGGGDAPAAAPKPAPTPAAGSGNRRMTPMYSVPVTNELFHNGNVEAWKKIIQSFQVKYPDCEVLVFYEGERIHDINTLFKWGKVKHGSTIVFAVVGEEIKDVAKLQRYFRQGASSQFEAFLRVPVNTVLNLF